MDPGAAIQAVQQIVQMIGDAKAWRLEVRKWAFSKTSGDLVKAEELEAWVHEASRVIGGRRREALRMWAYEHATILISAEQLYEWAVQAEERPDMPDDPMVPDYRKTFDQQG